MKIVIKIKDSAKLSRVEEFGTCLEELKDPEPDIEGFPDIIESISRE